MTSALFTPRRNVPALAAAGYRVYAIDLLGFGLSAKPIIDYDRWRHISPYLPISPCAPRPSSTTTGSEP